MPNQIQSKIQWFFKNKSDKTDDDETVYYETCKICKEDKTELDIHTNHIYEDIMIAKFLHKNGIHPSETPEIIKCRINDF